MLPILSDTAWLEFRGHQRKKGQNKTTHDVTTIDREYLDQLSVGQLRHLAHQLTEQSRCASREIQRRDAKIDKLALELAQLKRVQFGVKSERLS